MHWIGFLLDCRDKEDLRPDNASEPQQMRIYGPTFGLLLTSRQVFTNSSVNTTALGRWDEKAGLPRDADTLPMFDVLKAQRKGDRQCRRLALCARVEETFSKGGSPLGWIWEIAPVRTAFE